MHRVSTFEITTFPIIARNDIGNLFFVIVNNISYNKLEVENIIFKKNKNILKKEGFFKAGIVKYIQKSKNYKKEEEAVKKNTIMKGVLILIVLAVLTLGFGGCGALIIIPTTGTVVITIVGYYTYYNYNVYLDSWYNQIGITSGGTFTATGITPGSHTFYVDDTIWNYYYNYDTVWVTAGQTTYLTLYPY